MSTYEAVRTFPSGHHNAPYTPELGHHWPEGQRFKRKPENMQKHLQKRHGADRIFFEQIGGEEVTISIKATELGEYLRPVAPRIEQTEAGAQTVPQDMPPRITPTGPLKPKRAQNTAPLALEMPEIDAKQIKLF